ncbi:MAG: Ni/Fe hydrogenase subunit alpha [Pirellulales bacterium]|nr:Ni/Fe hydrogenase subunit alpha [Pirellulales bacterium]
MTESSPDRRIRIAALARVEGEGGLYVSLAGDRVAEIRLEIFEPPRLFESLLVGRSIDEVPDIVARICGICPVAYQMSAVHALERALEIEIPPAIERRRRLLYCGEWIESHGLHIHLLHAPDFLGYDNAWDMAPLHGEALRRGLRLKKLGNDLLAALGGRAIHPVNVAVGGFYRAPPAEQMRNLIPDFEWGLAAACEATRWVADFDFSRGDLHDDTRDEAVALVSPVEYPMNHGLIGSTRHPAIDVQDYERVFHEEQVPHSTALHARRTATDECYLVGPLARAALNHERWSPLVQALAAEVGFVPAAMNRQQAIVARGLELVIAYETALEILRSDDWRGPARVGWTPRAATGCAATEAPRGLLYHRYEIDADNRVVEAKIVPPTSQNQAQIESDLRRLVERLAGEPDDVLARRCEQLVRSYDPCISCSTHFLKFTCERT